MTNKSITLYVLIGIAGLALLFLSRQYQAHMNKESERQYHTLKERINLPRKKIPIVQDPINKKIEAIKIRSEEVNQPDNIAKRQANIKKTLNEREQFLRDHKLQFAGDPMSSYFINENAIMEIGRGGSYTLGLYVQKPESMAQVKSKIIKKLNITSDDFKPISFTPNAANGFRNQSLYEAESEGLYHMYFFATHPMTSNMVIMHFTIKNMTRVIEQYVDKRYRQLRATQ